MLRRRNIINEPDEVFASEGFFRKSVLRFFRHKLAVTGLILLVLITLMSVFYPLIGDSSKAFDVNYASLNVGPQKGNIMGTDALGRDVFMRLMLGGRVSLSVGFVSAICSALIGITLGGIAGFFGGKVDNIIMRFMDVILSVPSILLAIAFMAALGRGLDKAVLAIGIVSIPEYARIARSCVMAVKANDYIQAAIVSGDSNLRIIFRHILPNITSPIVVRATLGISIAVLDTAALGFLGLGVQPPYAEWGDMLARSRGFIFSAPYTLLFPGLAITITVLAFNLFGDGLRDALDPRSRRR